MDSPAATHVGIAVKITRNIEPLSPEVRDKAWQLARAALERAGGQGEMLVSERREEEGPISRVFEFTMAKS